MVSDEEGENWDGTGLGLPICLKLATSYNSFIRYGSQVGNKTVFQFYYPFQGTNPIVLD